MFPLALGIGTPEIGIILLVILLLFGARRIPELGKSLAQGIHEFKNVSRELKDDDNP